MRVSYQCLVTLLRGADMNKLHRGARSHTSPSKTVFIRVIGGGGWGGGFDGTLAWLKISVIASNSAYCCMHAE